MHVAMFRVDAFTDTIFTGNPAAVCPLASWPEDELLQASAAENNLSEPAYLVPQGDGFGLRWFTPKCEVNLCGHATLASGFVILNILHPNRESVRFETRSGTLTVARDAERLAMDFPARPPCACTDPPAELAEGLQASAQASAVLQIKDNYFVVYGSEEAIRGIAPDFAVLGKLHPFGVAVTAPGKDADFVSRYFAPSYGIPEDPVTGSTHCSLAPYWSKRLAKTTLHARQISGRGGEMWCEVKGQRVVLKGNAVLVMRGELMI